MTPFSSGSWLVCRFNFRPFPVLLYGLLEVSRAAPHPSRCNLFPSDLAGPTHHHVSRHPCRIKRENVWRFFPVKTCKVENTHHLHKTAWNRPEPGNRCRTGAPSRVLQSCFLQKKRCQSNAKSSTPIFHLYPILNDRLIRCEVWINIIQFGHRDDGPQCDEQWLNSCDSCTFWAGKRYAAAVLRAGPCCLRNIRSHNESKSHDSSLFPSIRRWVSAAKCWNAKHLADMMVMTCLEKCLWASKCQATKHQNGQQTAWFQPFCFQDKTTILRKEETRGMSVAILPESERVARQ